MDAENPAASSDARSVFYASTHPDQEGIWRVDVDGGGARRVVAGFAALPEVSPDGEHMLFLNSDQVATTHIRVVRVRDGARVPFDIAVPVPPNPAIVVRARWAADGRAIVFNAADESGRIGLFGQDFVLGQDTTATRRALLPASADWPVESFALSPDGQRAAVAVTDLSYGLMSVDGLEGIAPPAAR